MKRGDSAALPLFYKSVVPVLYSRHEALSLSEAVDYRFACVANSVPLAVTEFAYASRDYPIVFGEGARPVPFAVLGLRAADNLFVDDRGAWESGAYVPAYVRRYPFVLIEGAGDGSLMLGVDEESDKLIKGGGARLFKNGKISAHVEQVLAFGKRFYDDIRVSQDFGEALRLAGVLVSNKATINTESGEVLSLDGFSVIDKEAFNNLSDEIILGWRRKGWLDLVYSHLLSVSSWRHLLERDSKKRKLIDGSR